MLQKRQASLVPKISRNQRNGTDPSVTRFTRPKKPTGSLSRRALSSRWRIAVLPVKHRPVFFISRFTRTSHRHRRILWTPFIDWCCSTGEKNGRSAQRQGAPKTRKREMFECLLKCVSKGKIDWKDGKVMVLMLARFAI